LPAAWPQRASIGIVGLCIAIALLPFAIDWRWRWVRR
jgi:hypothetical protein